MEEEKGSLREEMKRLADNYEELSKKVKKKKFKIPFGARVSKRKVKQDYVIVQILNENKNIEFQKKPIIDGTVRLKDTVHAVDDLDVFFYKKTPMIHIARKYLTSYNPMVEQKDPLSKSNTTYGQKYIMNRMLKDTIKEGAKRISGAVIFFLIIGIIGAYYFFTQG